MPKCACHPDEEGTGTCRVCQNNYCENCRGSRFGVCNRCGFKIMIIVLIAMVVLSYTVWFGIL
jgi:hypothetical protein